MNSLGEYNNILSAVFTVLQCLFSDTGDVLSLLSFLSQFSLLVPQCHIVCVCVCVFYVVC